MTELFAKWLIIFVKGSILDIWLGFEYSSAVRDNYLSANFPTQPVCYFFLFSVVIQSFFFVSCSNFSVNSYIYNGCNWQENRVRKIGDVFQSVPL